MTARLPNAKTARRVVSRYLSPVVSPTAMLSGMRAYPAYFRKRRAYQTLEGARPLRLADDLPVVGEATATTPFDPHYTYLDGWAAREVSALMPTEHVDVASRLSFAVGLSAFVPVVFVDLRPVSLGLRDFRGVAGDLMALPFPDRSVRSLSCLHVIEHVGLGRYGDPLDPHGTYRAANELQRVLAPDGALFLGLPVGRPRVQFNAHRIHDPVEVLDMFAELRLVSFAAVDDHGTFHSTAEPLAFRDAEYACGCYRFTRSSAR